jgi:capsular polysaccharide biosynthesis protein
MPLSEYFRLLRRWSWMLVLLAVLMAASAYVFSRAQTPVYRSTVEIGVQPTRPDLGLTQSARTLLRYYVSVINTHEYAQRVIDVLELDVTKETLAGDVTIASDDSRFVIQIDVRNGNGDVANDIARVWAQEFVAWRDAENANVRREDKVNAALLDSPRYVLHRPQTRVNVLAGAILGLMLGSVLIFVMEYVESGVLRTAEEVERVLALPLMGAIPAAEGAGARRRASAKGRPHAG